MNHNFKDLTGQIFGRLTIVEYNSKDKSGQAKWLCKCECENYIIVTGGDLRKGHTKSCGCLRTENIIKRSTKHNNCRRGNETSEFVAWSSMKQRCYDKNFKDYNLYGGRGIKVCDIWLYSFENFLEDVGLKPTTLHSLDRYPNKDGNYEPGNVRWATIKEQANNKRNNIILEYKGESKTLSEWADKLGVTYSTLENRYRRGWTIERIFEQEFRIYD